MQPLPAWRPCTKRLPAVTATTIRQLSSSAKPVSLAGLFAAVERHPADGRARSGDDDDDDYGVPGVHIVHSAGTSPYANLAVEQRLLERSHPASRVLFLYHNAPCVVIGRNQNPWAEVRLGSLGGLVGSSGPALVRRRSGGGAVYHDAGNANWSVLGPAAGFDRDRHALMVARALRRLGAASARVNERHDIVVDGDQAGSQGGDVDRAYKVSGSAYKLTRHRFLHHGTCLLGADLAAVSGLLRAPPAAPYVLARGVASVRSPVRNVNVGAGQGQNDGRSSFAAAVALEFEAMYGRAATRSIVDVDGEAASSPSDAFSFDPPLARGYAELMSPGWLYGQTPQFSFSTRPTDEDPRRRPPLPPGVPPLFHLSFTARHGRLHDVAISGLIRHSSSAQASTTTAADRSLAAALDGQLLYEIRDWQDVLARAAQTSNLALDAAAAAAVGAWLDSLLVVDKASG